jgi:RHS repeat-associated protein
VTDRSANPTDDYSYDVFGTIRSQSGSSDNYWLFTGEQLDGQPGVAAGVQRLPLDVVVSSTNLTGATVANLDDDPDAPDGNWATATSVADTSLRVGFPTPPADPTLGADLQEFRVLLRKDAAGGNDPTYDIELWETGGGAPLATLASGVTLSSDTGVVVSATWDASLLGSADGSAVELVIVGNRSGGNPSKRRTVEVGAVEWNVDHQGAPGSELYFLRARYYDPETGRFLGQDPLPAVNLYAYVGNNPTNFIDPSGLCKWGLPCPPDPRSIVNPVIDLLPEGTLFEIPIINTGISNRLAVTCILYPEACAAAVAAMPVAQSATRLLYSAAQRAEGTIEDPKEGDAFQHCYWSGLITLQVGAHKAKAVTTRFEAVGDVANLPERRDYDLHNNERGREFVQRFASGLGPVGGAAALLAYCRWG